MELGLVVVVAVLYWRVLGGWWKHDCSRDCRGHPSVAAYSGDGIPFHIQFARPEPELHRYSCSLEAL